MKKIGCIVGIVLSVFLLWCLYYVWPYIFLFIIGPPKSQVSYELNNNKYRIMSASRSSNGRFTLCTYIKSSKKMTDGEFVNFIKSFHYNRQIDSLYQMRYWHDKIPYIMDTLQNYKIAIFPDNLRDPNDGGFALKTIKVKLDTNNLMCLNLSTL